MNIKSHPSPDNQYFQHSVVGAADVDGNPQAPWEAADMLGSIPDFAVPTDAR